MSRTVRIVVAATVPDNFGPVSEDDLSTLFYHKRKGTLQPGFAVYVEENELTDGKGTPAHRAGWKVHVYRTLFGLNHQRVTLAQMANTLGLGDTADTEKKALAELMSKMARVGTIKRERQAGSHEWRYWV